VVDKVGTDSLGREVLEIALPVVTVGVLAQESRPVRGPAQHLVLGRVELPLHCSSVFTDGAEKWVVVTLSEQNGGAKCSAAAASRQWRSGQPAATNRGGNTDKLVPEDALLFRGLR
jgi:hypothetical protein